MISLLSGWVHVFRAHALLFIGAWFGSLLVADMILHYQPMRRHCSIKQLQWLRRFLTAMAVVISITLIVDFNFVMGSFGRHLITDFFGENRITAWMLAHAFLPYAGICILLPLMAWWPLSEPIDKKKEDDDPVAAFLEKFHFDPKQYRFMVEKLLEMMPDRKQLFVFGEVSQGWAFDLSDADGRYASERKGNAFFEAMTCRTDDVFVGKQAEQEIDAICDQLKALGIPPEGFTSMSAWGPRVKMAVAIWSFYAIPFRWHDGKFFHLRPTGDVLDRVVVVAIDPSDLPVVLSDRLSKVENDFDQFSKTQERKVRIRNWAIITLIAVLSLILLKR